MKKTLEELNEHHVTTWFYHPQSNGKVERFHRTMHDILAKKIGHNEQSWDVYINQMLAAVRFHVSETTKFSPYYLLYIRDVILPLDNIEGLVAYIMARNIMKSPCRRCIALSL